MIKAVFHIALRALQGFVKSLIKILGLDLMCPHYSVFSRRAKDLLNGLCATKRWQPIKGYSG